VADLDQLKNLINSNNGCITMLTFEEEYALDMIRATATDLNREMWVWSVVDGVRDGVVPLRPPVPQTDVPHQGLLHFMDVKPGTICVTLDIGEFLKDNRTLRCWRDLVDNFARMGSTLIMINASEQLPEVVKSYARDFEVSLPGPKELFEILRDTIRELHDKKPVEVGISKTGLEAIVRNLRGLTRRQAKRIIIDAISTNQRFTDGEIHEIIAAKRSVLGKDGLLEFIQSPLDLGEIGGMSNLKEWLRLRKDAFTPEAQAFGLRPPRGVLMLGIQGAGKSLCAKAIATAWQQPLLRLDPGVLYNSYIGETEHNLRMALNQAQAMAPVVLWIDEIEKAFASAASRSADGGLSQRMFGTLLTWLQEHTAPVFVVATANNIEALPPELLRKGRFDEIFFIDLPRPDARKEIFKIHLLKRKRDPNQFDLDALAANSQGYSGAEIEQAIISALHTAYGCKSDLTTDTIIVALKNSPPLSVTMAEAVQELTDWSKGRCVPVD
jgi:AAA+ superfamily predicted ATPase